MSERLLREYLNEVLLTELHVDTSFLNHLRRSSGLNIAPALGINVDDLDMRPVYRAGTNLANKWLRQAERRLGAPLRRDTRAEVFSFVARRFPVLVLRYRGDIDAASQTMNNILNTRFNDLRTDNRR